MYHFELNLNTPSRKRKSDYNSTVCSGSYFGGFSAFKGENRRFVFSKKNTRHCHYSFIHSCMFFIKEKYEFGRAWFLYLRIY
jgi:hypothetical protein